MRKAVCPGSFDPVTNGHLDIIERASGSMTKSSSAVLVNKNKQGLFTVEERIELLREVTASCRTSWSIRSTGCWSTSAGTRTSAAIVKGLRAVSDFDYELQMAQMNHQLAGVDTFFVSTNPLY